MMKKFAIVTSVLALAASAYAADYPFPGLPGAIPDNNATGISRDVVVSDGFSITDVELVMSFSPEHTWAGDLVVTLTKIAGAGTGATSNVMNRIGKTDPNTGFGRSDDMNGTYTFGDNAGYGNIWTVAAVGGDIPGGSYRATGALSSAPISLTTPFLGLSAAGTYRLTITDLAAGDTGTLSGATLRLVPEPATLALLALGGLTLIRRR